MIFRAYRLHADPLAGPVEYGIAFVLAGVILLFAWNKSVKRAERERNIGLTKAEQERIERGMWDLPEGDVGYMSMLCFITGIILIIMAYL